MSKLRSVPRFAAVAIMLGACCLLGPADAQPNTQAPLPTIETPGRAAPSEQAPPASVPPPTPIAAPPITETEVSPAPPPENAVAAQPAAPAHRTRYDVAVLQALDKVTAESLRFEAQVGRPVRYKSLIFTVKACEHAAPDEPIDDSIAYLTIDSQPRSTPGGPPMAARQAFRGWMYASSPGLHPLEHPVYDAWLITCRAAAPPIAPPAALPKAAPTVNAAASRR